VRDYEIFHLEPGASFAELQQSYRDLVRVWHPDRFAGDPRLQKIAEEKLREINRAYLVLEKIISEPPQSTEPAAPRRNPTKSANTVPTFYGRPAQHYNFARLWVLLVFAFVAFGAFRVYEFFQAPMRALASISADARRVAAWNGPTLVDAFEGWNGVLPQGLDQLLKSYQSAAVAGQRDVEILRLPVRSSQTVKSAPRSATPSAFLLGVGEIQVHNRTKEDMLLTLRARVHIAARAGIEAPAKSDVILGDLGPDLYTVDVSFPHSQRSGIRLGPFVMLEIETAANRTGDRYEITLKP